MPTVSQRMCQLLRLVLVLSKRVQKNNSVLEEFIDTAYFDTIVDAELEPCNFDPELRLDVGIPSLALKLGHSIKQFVPKFSKVLPCKRRTR